MLTYHTNLTMIKIVCTLERNHALISTLTITFNY